MAIKKIKGRKRNLLVDSIGIVLFVAVCSASTSDSDAAEHIINETYDRFPRLEKVLVDQGYDDDLVDWAQDTYGWTLEIVRKQPNQYGFVAQPLRWRIERTFGWMNWSRLLSKEYERTTEASETNIYLASIRMLLKRLSRC